jgi:tRNA-2-methylthio-N6-dimethylallyladenosine synthase
VVPYTRGAEVSRPAARVEAEARDLIARGAVEITLLGQNVNAYRDRDGVTLAALVRRLARIEELRRIRYTTSHPNDMDDDLIATHGEEPKLMPFLHLPVQSGSDRVLKAMNRSHDGASYLRLIERVRAARPDMAISGDFIVGFPGETDEDFEATLALASRARFAQAFTFKYSARPGTPAADFEDQVPETVKGERLYALQELIDRDRRAFDKATVGRRLKVLFEAKGRKPGQIAGRSPYLQAVHVGGPAGLIGRIAEVDILAASPNSLTGVIKSGFEWHEPVQAAV